jgi:hypothetical protein
MIGGMTDQIVTWHGVPLTEETDKATLLDVSRHLADLCNSQRQRIAELHTRLAMARHAAGQAEFPFAPGPALFLTGLAIGLSVGLVI